MLNKLIQRLAALQPLDAEAVAAAVSELVKEDVASELKAAFLTHLSRKGETPEEITAFVKELASRAVQPQINGTLRSHEILDIVGTGGDRLSTFNISTTVALIASSLGVRVAKHGNRASTSLVGSADVMEALGIRLDLTPEQAVQCLTETGFGFFFAPKYHPAFRHIAPARKLCAAQGQTTIFNFLGPLLNPVRPSAALVGVPRPELCQPLACVLQAIGVRRAMVVSGSVTDETGATRQLDEVSPLGPTHVAEFYQAHGMNSSVIDPSLFPIQPARLADLRGGGRDVNERIIRQLLAGEERGPKRDAVLLNAAAALFVAQRSTSLIEGWQLAADAIDSGLAERKLRQLQSWSPAN